MPDIFVDDVVSIAPEELSSGTYLFLLHADKVPPHLGLISKGREYSLSANGNVVGEGIENLLRLIKVKKIPTLFIELKGDHDLDIMDEEFSLFRKAIPGTVTCLNPIRSYLGRIYNINTFETQYVFELIPLLRANDKIKGAYQLHLESKLDDGQFKLMTYTKKEIDDRIKEVRDKK